MSHRKWIAEQRFRCVPREGRPFDLVVRIGEPETVEPSEEGEHAYGRCWLSLAPLTPDRWLAGENQFQALCLGLEHIRVVFRIFLADGGRIYWDDTDSHVDIESSWFGPMPSIPGLSLRGGEGAA